MQQTSYCSAENPLLISCLTFGSSYEWLWLGEEKVQWFKEAPVWVWMAAVSHIWYYFPARAKGVEYFVNMLYIVGIFLKSPQSEAWSCPSVNIAPGLSWGCSSKKLGLDLLMWVDSQSLKLNCISASFFRFGVHLNHESYYPSNAKRLEAGKNPNCCFLFFSHQSAHAGPKRKVSCFQSRLFSYFPILAEFWPEVCLGKIKLCSYWH